MLAIIFFEVLQVSKGDEVSTYEQILAKSGEGFTGGFSSLSGNDIVILIRKVAS